MVSLLVCCSPLATAAPDAATRAADWLEHATNDEVADPTGLWARLRSGEWLAVLEEDDDAILALEYGTSSGRASCRRRTCSR